MRIIALLLLLTTFQKIYSQEYYLLAGTYTKAERSEGIYLYTFSLKTGDGTLKATAFTENPSYLALDRHDAHLYAVNERGNGKGAVSSFAFDKKTGAMTPINSQNTDGDDPCFVSIDSSNRWLVTANYSGGSFSVFPLKADGSIGEVTQVIQHTGTGPNKERQEKAHVHSAVFSPDSRYLAVADLGMDQITVYPFDADAAKPVSEPPLVVATKPGSGPRHILFHPKLPFVYSIEELSGNVVVYSYADGKFGEVQTIGSHPSGYDGEKGSAAIHFSPDGKFLYTSNRGQSNSIAIFSVDGSSGRLTTLGYQPTGGDHPRDFNIDPSGNFLLVGNMKSGYVSVFKRNKRTGLMSGFVRKITIPQPTQLLFTHVK